MRLKIYRISTNFLISVWEWCISPQNVPHRPSYTVQQLSQGPSPTVRNPLWILLLRGRSPTMTEQAGDTKACCSRRHKLLCQLTLAQELPDSFTEPSLDIKGVWDVSTHEKMGVSALLALPGSIRISLCTSIFTNKIFIHLISS